MIEPSQPRAAGGWIAFVLVWAFAVAGCSSLPPAPTSSPAHAIARSEQTALGRIAAKAQTDEDLTGFRLMPSGANALTARLELIARAEATLDVQYYQIENDATGRTFLRALRDAARRGVRVRLLVDDLYTAGEDELFLGLAATPHLEVRLFNPFPAGRAGFASRFAASLLDFDRINRRMHNKLFIADGAIAVVGGRNIGDAYFTQTRGDNFVDIDAVVAGALVPRLGTLFDRYWNSEFVRPIGNVARSDSSHDELAQRFDRETDPATTPAPLVPAPNDVLGYGPVVDELRAGRLDLVWARAEAWADDPGRVVGRQVSYGGAPLLDVDSVRYNVRERLRRARSEVTLVSPYLIPGRDGLEAIDEVTRRGVRLSLVTNSLASTDEPLVYGAYRRYRPELLRLGVRIWEVSTSRTLDSVRLGLLGSRTGRLHAKSAVFDREAIFIGSMNLDPRSDTHNTEIGLIVDSHRLSAQMLRLVETLKQQGSYRVRLAANGRGVEWVDGQGEGERVLTTDPDTDVWMRWKLDVLSPLVPESLL